MAMSIFFANLQIGECILLVSLFSSAVLSELCVCVCVGGGGGVQRRTVDCRNTIAQTAAVSCPRCLQPQSSQPCNEHECPVEGQQVVTRFSRAFL